MSKSKNQNFKTLIPKMMETNRDEKSWKDIDRTARNQYNKPKESIWRV